MSQITVPFLEKYVIQFNDAKKHKLIYFKVHNT